MSRPPPTLPNLSGLRLGGPVCRPCGATFDDFQDAQGTQNATLGPDIDYFLYPTALYDLISARPVTIAANTVPGPHAEQAYELLASAWEARFNGEGQIPDDLLVATAEGIKTHYDQVTAGFWKTYTEMLIRVTAYLWGGRDDETLWIETMELPRQYARVGVQLFGMGPPMFQGQRVHGIEYEEVKSLVGGREGWLVTAVFNIGDRRLRGGNAFNFALEVYRSTDFQKSDAMLVDHDGKFVAKVVRSTRRWSMSDFNKAAWTHLKKQNPPIGVAKGLSTSDFKDFYYAVLVALGLPVDTRRTKKRREYNSYRERESRRDELPEDW